MENVKKYSTSIVYPAYFPINKNGEDDELNQPKHLWWLNPDQITPEQYMEFYESLRGGENDIRYAVKHIRMEEEKIAAILFVPSPSHSNSNDYLKTKRNMRLYNRGLFICEIDSVHLVGHPYFIKGVVDSNALPLNMSDKFMAGFKRVIGRIRYELIKYCLQMLLEINEERYCELYEALESHLRLWLIKDADRMAYLANLLRFKSNHSHGQLVGLAMYVKMMKTGQSVIYYYQMGEERELPIYRPFSIVEKTNYTFELLFDYQGIPIVEACELPVLNFIQAEWWTSGLVSRWKIKK